MVPGLSGVEDFRSWGDEVLLVAPTHDPLLSWSKLSGRSTGAGSCASGPDRMYGLLQPAVVPRRSFVPPLWTSLQPALWNAPHSSASPLFPFCLNPAITRGCLGAGIGGFRQ